MLPRFNNRLVLSLSLVWALVAVACEKVPLLAPTGSTIVLTAGTNVLPTNGTIPLVAQVTESSGTPPHSGTRVTFTTSLGTIEPSSAQTDLNGTVAVTFRSGTASGTATITAFSGGATTGSAGALTIAVGTAAVGRVIIDASPATVPAVGGTTTITASVLDINGNTLASTPVVFTKTAGTFLSPATVNTNASGVATVTLSTGQQTVVTASVGSAAPPPTGTGGTTTTPTPASASVTITIAAAPSIVITLPSTAPSVGVPSTYTFTITAATGGSAVRSVVVDWGEGPPSSLGAISGAQPVAHVYDSSGTKTISATVTDASGNTSTVSTSVTVIPVPRPAVLVTPTPQTQVVNGNISFNIQITMPSGIGIQNTTIYFGGGGGGGDETRSLGGASSARVDKVYTTPGQRTVVVTVHDTVNNFTDGTATVSITP